MNELALFAGAGGGILGGHLLGWRTVCAVEYAAYPASVLLARQNDGVLPAFPVWDDVRTFDGRPWRGLVDVVSGGFPCQDISGAGKGAGIEGERSGLWREMARIVGEVRPRFVYVENSPLLVGRGLAVVLGDLAAMGYDAQWFRLSASDCGAPHERDRLWLVANANSDRFAGEDLLLQSWRQEKSDTVATRDCQTSSNAGSNGLERPIYLGNCETSGVNDEGRASSGGTIAPGWKSNHPEPGVLGMDDGLACWMDRIAAAGNGQVPRVAATAFSMLC